MTSITLPVSQEARNHAADLAALAQTGTLIHIEAPAIRRGDHDDWGICQAFAKFETQIRNAILEEAAGMAERYPSLEYADIPIIRGIAHAIRQLGEREA